LRQLDPFTSQPSPRFLVEWVYRKLGLLAAFVGLRAKPRAILIGHASE
jgi:hypothetical protein